MTTWAFWAQTIYSVAGLVVGFVVGRYLPRRPPPNSNTMERRVASRRAADGKRDIPKMLTITILIMMVASVGGVVQNTISQNHLRDQRRADIYAELHHNEDSIETVKQLALRVRQDEQLLTTLVISISKAQSQHDVTKAINTFIRKARKADNQPIPGVPKSEQPPPIVPPTIHVPKPKPQTSPAAAPRPVNTHPPPKHHPKPKPSPTPKPVVPVPVPIPVPGPQCLSVPFLGPVICKVVLYELAQANVGQR